MKKVFLVVIIALISFAPAKASHLMGGEITWECIKTGVNSGLYVFTLKVYREQIINIRKKLNLITIYYIDLRL